MGLAPYGDDRFVGDFRRLLGLEGRCSGGRLFQVDLDFFRFFLDAPGRVSSRFVDVFGPAREAEEPIDERHRKHDDAGS